MNNKILIYVIALLLSLNCLSEEILLKNATIHTATNQGSLENSDILIRDGYIVRIGENISSSSAIVVNLSGKEVSPGLIAPLSQLGIVEIGLVPETRDDTSNIYSAGLSIDSAFNPSSTLIPYNLTGGVTLTLTSPSSSGLFSGMTSVFSLSGSLEESLVASNIALSVNISGGEDSKAAKILLLEDSLDIASSMWRAWSPLPKNSYYSPRDLRAIKRVLKRDIPLVVLSLIHI